MILILNILLIQVNVYNVKKVFMFLCMVLIVYKDQVKYKIVLHMKIILWIVNNVLKDIILVLIKKVV